MQYTESFLVAKKNKIIESIFDIFYILAQNIDCGYPQSMFGIKYKKNRFTPANPSFPIYKWGLGGIPFTDMVS